MISWPLICGPQEVETPLPATIALPIFAAVNKPLLPAHIGSDIPVGGLHYRYSHLLYS